MQAAAVTVAAVPTALLSNHPHYPTMRGRILDDGLVDDLLRGVKERGLVERATVLITGYLGSPEIAHWVTDFVADARKRNPRLIYLCDPVMGDDDLGVFVADGIAEVFRDQLVLLALLITPNPFELEYLTAHEARDVGDLRTVCKQIANHGCQAVIATGCTLADTASGQVETILCEAGPYDAGNMLLVATPRLPIRPCGTGDLLAGLTAAHLANGATLPDAMRYAVEGTHAILEKTCDAQAEELCLV